jgi:hypothetical protein
LEIDARLHEDEPRALALALSLFFGDFCEFLLPLLLPGLDKSQMRPGEQKNDSR